ncbi:hypothetical protein AAF712_011211 [Marasmius tenuissimus]|uniref:Uncharacterized protein n=1 Tax=Marasmius tenuissimus TaxID=585030 RepID=A0ABR2ZL78_9AGAR
MKVTINFVFVSLFLSSFVTGLPVQRRKAVPEAGRVVKMNDRPGQRNGGQGNNEGQGNNNNNATNGAAAGALYFITNEDDGNFVVSADIAEDGKVSLRQAISAGGFGIRGDDGNKNNPAPLFSQGAVSVSATSKLLATVNAGSNTLALFSIDEKDPAVLTKIGSLVGSGGEFPISVAFNSKGDTLCALNGGEVNSVSCFKANNEDGLTPLAGGNRILGLKQTTPATGAPASASHILFSEDDKQLIASVKGIPDPNNGRGVVGALAVYDVGNNGALSEEPKVFAPPENGLAPFGMALVPNKKAVVVADPANGFDVIDIETGDNANSKSVAVDVDDQKATGWAAFSKKTGNFYLTDAVTGRVTEVKVEDDLKGSVVSQTDLGNNSGPIDNVVATIKDKDFLFVLSSQANAIDVLSLDGAGKVTKVDKTDIADPAKQANLKLNSINIQGMAAFVKP